MQSIFETTHKIFDQIKNSISDIKINIDDNQHLIISLLYGTIIENASCCIILFDKNHFTGIPILLRNMLEAYADLKNVRNDENYCFSLNLSFLLKKQKLLKHMIQIKENKDPSSKLIVQYKKDLNDTNNYIEQLKKDGHKVYEIYDRFDKANIADLYGSLYNILCQESHNNICMLENRHIIKTNNQIDSIVFFKKRSIDEEYRLIHFITWLLLLSFREVQEFYNLKESSNTIKIAELADTFSQQEMNYFKNII